VDEGPTMETPTAAEIDHAAYLKGSEACRLLGRHHRALRRLVASGLVGTLELPGCPPRYSRADVERVLASARRPAGTGGGG
jgi:hypothetical protein